MLYGYFFYFFWWVHFQTIQYFNYLSLNHLGALFTYYVFLHMFFNIYEHEIIKFVLPIALAMKHN
jgi:hypothetical protein